MHTKGFAHEWLEYQKRWFERLIAEFPKLSGFRRRFGQFQNKVGKFPGQPVRSVTVPEFPIRKYSLFFKSPSGQRAQTCSWRQIFTRTEKNYKSFMWMDGGSEPQAQEAITWRKFCTTFIF